jgi:hypothetical protein
MLTHCAYDGGKKARSPRRARRKPLKPLRGESRMIPSEPVVTNSYAFSFCMRGYGCSGHPAFPAPSNFRGMRYMQDSGTRVPRDRGGLSNCRGPACTGRSSIPEMPVIEPRSRSVLDTPLSRGMTVGLKPPRHCEERELQSNPRRERAEACLRLRRVLINWITTLPARSRHGLSPHP